MTDYKSTIAELHYLADWAKHHLDKAKIANDAADAIDTLQSKLGDAIQSLANWQYQCEEAQAENERLKAEKAGLEHVKNAFGLQMQTLQAKLDAMGKGEQIYQYLMGDGSWIDQAKQSYDYNRNHAPHAVMRIVYAAPKALAPLTDEQMRDAFAQALTDVYVCTRVWSAWSYGTMTEDDFSPASECDEVLDSLVQAAHGIGGTP